MTERNILNYAPDIVAQSLRFLAIDRTIAPRDRKHRRRLP
jgi:hypothetical protein